MAQFRVEQKFAGDGVDYLFDQIKKYDLSMLNRAWIKTGRSNRTMILGYGNIRATRHRLTGEIKGKIGLNVSILDRAFKELPRHVKLTRKYGSGIAYDAKAQDVQELIVAVGMHELRHFLGYSGQLGGKTTQERMRIGADEIDAMRWGWVHMAFFRAERGLVAA